MKRNTDPAATLACHFCRDGRVVHYSWRGGESLRCGACKGTGRVTPRTWLIGLSALPRPIASRTEALARTCHALGLSPSGEPYEDRPGVTTLPNGFAGLVADLRTQGYADIAERAKARYLAERPCDTGSFDRDVLEVERARAAMAAPRQPLAMSA